MMLKAIMKRIVPSRMRAVYRLHGKYSFYRNRIRDLRNANNFCLLLGTPVHENMGDHLITYAETMMLNSVSDKTVVDIPIEAYKLFRNKIIKAIDPTIPIYIQGGGWMGSVYPNDERLIQDMIRDFPNNKKIVFPQTVYYEDMQSELIVSGREVYRRSELLHVFLREKKSYELMKKLYPDLNVYLEPDIALYLKGRVTISEAFPRKGIGICFRNDIENSNTELKTQIRAYFQEKRFQTEGVDTISPTSVSEAERNDRILERFMEFSKYELVVTDRLHGMVFSYISNTPCIAIDNKTNKVSSVYYSWLKNSKSVFLVKSFDEFIQIIEGEKMFEKDDTLYNFHKLHEVITNG